MARLRYNGLRSTLGGSLSSGATTITFLGALAHSGGTAVPTLSGGDYIPLAILDSTTGALEEIVHLTAYTSGATSGTILRGQASTTGVAHSVGDLVVNAPFVADIPALGTAATLDVPASGDATSGQVVKGSDTRLTDSRTPTTHTHTKSQVTDLGTIGTAAALASDTDTTLAANSDTRLATQKAVKAYADALLDANNAFVYKGGIDCSATPNYPAASAGHTYKVTVAGIIGGPAGTVVQVGDTATCLVDGTASGNQATVGTNWLVMQTNIDGAVIGPAISTADHIVTFDGITGKLVKDSGWVRDTDGTLAADSDSRFPTQKAIKTYSQPKNDTLTALASVAADEDTLPYFDGDGTAATVPMSAYVHDFIGGVTSKEDARDVIGVAPGGLRYLYAEVGSDPGAGELKVDVGGQVVYVNEIDIDSNDWSAQLSGLNGSSAGTFQITDTHGHVVLGVDYFYDGQDVPGIHRLLFNVPMDMSSFASGQACWLQL